MKVIFSKQFILAISIFAITIASINCFAQTPSESLLDRNDLSQFTEYFTIDQQVQSESQNFESGFINPITIFEEIVEPQPQEEIESTYYDLFSWTKHNSTPPLPKQKYSRSTHFGGWATPENAGHCYNTRAQVLMRDSLTPVKYKEQNPCLVDSGTWIDPYSGTKSLNSHDIQIDHFVPLKNAYVSGAWDWPREKRCHYGNFLSYKFHLLPVYGPQNSKKSDKTPADYLPPDEKYICQYLQQWLTIKITWSLLMSPPEAESIQKNIKTYNCDSKLFRISKKDITELQAAAEEFSSSSCSDSFFRKDQGNSEGIAYPKGVIQ